ncbi:MAG: trimeric intracellular cation channel family protein [Bacteroides sp.]|nr:trimeric intracellular cation channel family protein [Bacteroides sp.]MBD5306488.1 trimeric intracellular cation channel family protein [Bacteroides sp.]
MNIETTFLFIIEVVGTIAFAISGIRLAAYKKFDLFGAYTIGLVTATGGGTLRDMMLNLPVFWLQTPVYIAVTGLSLAIVIIFRRVLVSHNRILFTFDAIGLALFVVIGIQKTYAAGYPIWAAVIMGMVTGSFGGVVRDILINEEPLFFRKDIYATACLAGGFVYWLLMVVGCPQLWQQIACAVTVIGLRVCALKFNWALPVLSYDIKSQTHHRE